MSCPLLGIDALLRERQKAFAISDFVTLSQHLLTKHDRDAALTLIHKDKCSVFAVPFISALQKKEHPWCWFM